MILRAQGRITLTGGVDDIPALAEEEGIQTLYIGALAANTAACGFGRSDTSGGLTLAKSVEIPKGGGHYLDVVNIPDLRVIGTSGDIVCWAAYDKA